MKATINGKRYDSERCEVIGEKDCYSYSNNYTGTSYLLRAKDGQLLYQHTSNGQDGYRESCLCSFDDVECIIDDFDMDEEQEKLAEKYGLIEIV